MAFSICSGLCISGLVGDVRLALCVTRLQHFVFSTVCRRPSGWEAVLSICSFLVCGSSSTRAQAEPRSFLVAVMVAVPVWGAVWRAVG
jgi:hypothetical protein